MEKKCSKCEETKPVGEFHKQKATKDGLQNYCKVCDRNGNIKHRRSLRGKLMGVYNHMKASQKTRTENNGTVHSVKFTKGEFVNWAISHPDYLKLHKEWVESGYKKESAPSFDRLDDYGDYSLDNFNKWMTWGENKRKGHIDRLSGVNVKHSKAVRGVHLKTGKVVEFYSQQEAARQLGINRAHISSCCLGRKGFYSAGGYIWEFSDLNGEKQNDRSISSQNKL